MALLVSRMGLCGRLSFLFASPPSLRSTTPTPPLPNGTTHPLGPIHHPTRHQEVPRLHLLPQTAHRAEPHRRPDAQLLERGHIGPVRDLVRRVLVVLAVAGEEGDDCGGRGGGGRGVGEDGDGGGGETPGGGGRGDQGDGGEGGGGEGGESGAADYGDGDGVWGVLLVVGGGLEGRGDACLGMWWGGCPFCGGGLWGGRLSGEGG